MVRISIFTMVVIIDLSCKSPFSLYGDDFVEQNHDNISELYML